MPDNSNRYAMMKIAEEKARLMRVMEKARSLSGSTGEELAAHWTKNICWYLYKRCRDLSPTAAAFGTGSGSIAAEHDFKIAWLKNGVKVSPSPFSDKGKTRHAFSRVREIMQYRGKHRMYIASGWLNVKKIVTKAGSKLVPGKIRNGAIVVQVSRGFGTTVNVTIANLSKFARPFHDKHGIVQAALEDERIDLAEYIARKTKQDVQTILATY